MYLKEILAYILCKLGEAYKRRFPYVTKKKKRMLVMKKKPPLGSGKRFAALERSIAEKGDVEDPAAVAAMIGRKKYGTVKMAKMATAGRKRAAKKK